MAPTEIPEVGEEIPAFVRQTGFDNWNRYAAVNDEFVPIHMDDEAGQAPREMHRPSGWATCSGPIFTMSSGNGWGRKGRSSG